MRALLALLLLANLGFFALTQGWLEPIVGLRTQQQREPHRLAEQINPDTVRVLDAAAAGAALRVAAPAPVPASASFCLQAGPFTVEQVETAEAALAPLQLPASAWQRVRGDAGATAPGATLSPAPVAAYWLRVGQADAALRERLLRLPPLAAAHAFEACARTP